MTAIRMSKLPKCKTGSSEQISSCCMTVMKGCKAWPREPSTDNTLPTSASNRRTGTVTYSTDTTKKIYDLFSVNSETPKSFLESYFNISLLWISFRPYMLYGSSLEEWHGKTKSHSGPHNWKYSQQKQITGQPASSDEICNGKATKQKLSLKSQSAYGRYFADEYCPFAYIIV